MTRRRKLTLLFCLLGLVGVLPAVAYFGVLAALPSAIVCAPNQDKTAQNLGDPDAAQLRAAGVSEHFRVAVGPPAASLSCYLLEPEQEAIGTILIFHGIRDSKESQLGIGTYLRSLGYRAVLVDGRGHGRSTGKYLTFGVVESRDAVQILDWLKRRGKLTEPVGAVGVSYGGAVAIQTAARDARIKAVVSVSTFSSLEGALDSYVADRVPIIGSLYTAGQLKKVAAEAGQLASFDPSDADTAAAARRTRAAILLLHGDRDEKVPPHHAEAIRRAGGNRVKLILVPDEDHDSITADRTGIIRAQMTEWFSRRLQEPGPGPNRGI